ncbi:hypothetical protein COB11_03340 [Candidatus Aerophobetes bacterium]|uniref:Uncharacterized protein n=1 Tax=Aerophobetes bacterium TaxID=2030807 RepID=A0A2A4YJF1_UNCAE|nr:MAG: hypothetical protein COB11_03340 [Candidatus Aerophobetes bacterium]
MSFSRIFRLLTAVLIVLTFFVVADDLYVTKSLSNSVAVVDTDTDTLLTGSNYPLLLGGGTAFMAILQKQEVRLRDNLLKIHAFESSKRVSLRSGI